MTKILSEIEAVGKTVDGKNYEDGDIFEYSVFYDDNLGTACVKHEDTIFTVDAIEELVNQMHYIQATRN